MITQPKGWSFVEVGVELCRRGFINVNMATGV